MRLRSKDLLGVFLSLVLATGFFTLARATDEAAVGPVDPFKIPVRTQVQQTAVSSGQSGDKVTPSPTATTSASITATASTSTTVSSTSGSTETTGSPTATPKKVNIKIKVTGPSSRMLGGVKITFSGKQIATITDPPPLTGTLVKDVAAGSYEIIAERTTGGYELYDENTTIPDDKSNYDLTIQMRLVNTNNEANNLGDTASTNYNNTNYPSMSDPTGLNWWSNSDYNTEYGGNNWGSPLSTGCGGIMGVGCPAGYRCVYQKYGGVIASDATGQCVSENEYQRYQNTQDYSLFGNDNNVFSNNYNLSLNSSNISPVDIVINSTASTSQNSNPIRVSIFEKANTTQAVIQNTISATEDQNHVYACLKPNTNYTMELLGSGTNGLKPLYYDFSTPSSNNYLQINVSSLSFVSGTGQVKIGSGILTSSSDLRSKCQQQNNSSSLSSAPVTFSDPSMNATDLLSSNNFQITRDWRNGDFYMINLNNRSDVRKIYLIETTNNSSNNLLTLGTEGHRGMGFFSAEANSYYNQNSVGDSGNWYIFIYQTDTNGDNLKIVNNQMSKGNISPTMYSNLVRNQFLTNFTTSF